MAKFKKGRVGIRMDMTPMVDVAFLLLTFFMLTTQFKPTEEVEIDLPVSHSEFKLPESDVMIVTVSKEGKYFLGLDSQGLREKLFGEAGKFKASMELEKIELSSVLIRARISNPKLRTVIKADKNAPFGPVEDLMNILQEARISRFNLITDLEKT